MMQNLIQKIEKKPKIVFGAVSGAIGLVVVIGLLASGVWQGKLPESFTGEVDVKPVYASEYGVGVAQGFIITSDEPMTAALVSGAFVSEPFFEFTLARSDGGKTFKVIPNGPLLANTVYQISFDPGGALAGKAPRASYTWAFQTEKDFRLQGSIPTDQGTGVPINTVLRFTFTQAVDAKAMSGHFSAEPEITGRWEGKGSLLTFIPDNDLSMNTVYTINIRGGLPNQAGNESIPEDIEIKFQTMTREEAEKDFWYRIENDNNCFRIGEIPAFRYYRGWDEKPFDSFSIKIYEFADEESYIEALKSRKPEYYWSYADTEKIIDTGRLTKVTSFEEKELKGFVLRCPESLAAGYYLADFTALEIRRQSLFQVTDLACYYAAGESDGLIWLNDLKTQKPVSGARVLLTGTEETAVTDDMGVAVIGAGESNPVLSIQRGGDRLVMSGYNYYAGEERPAINRYDYWYHLSTDREIYLPGDTLYYFGIMAPRDDGKRHFTEAELVIYGGGYWEESAIRHKVQIENGVLSGDWELPILKTGWYQVSLEVEGQSFAYSYFEVEFYDKPAYRFGLSSDKKAVFAGEPITWSIHAGYFEGTPVTGLQVTTRYEGTERRITTDGKGDTQVTYAAPPPKTDYLTNSTWLHASAVMPELGDVSTYSTVTVFNQNVDIDGQVKRDKSSFFLRLDGYDVDLDSINNEGASIWKNEYRRPLSGRVDLQASLIRIEYDKVANGPFYNQYTLQTYYTYSYNRREINEGNFSMTLTSGGLDFAGELESSYSYILRVTGKDHRGRTFTRSYYIPEEGRGGSPNIPEGEGFWENFSWGDRYYRYFYIEKISGSIDENYYGRWGTRNAVGDELKFTVGYSGMQVPKPERGNILYFRSQETVRDYGLSTDGTYSMTFEEIDIPNVNLSAVCFDGKYYIECEPHNIMLDPADKAAKVDIATDKRRYAPGETVRMSLFMTDKDGGPLSGSVNISIVDEALFALAENYVDIGYSVFNNMYSCSYWGSVSHMPVDTGASGAEMGDGGGEREDFRDTAFFSTLETDEDGYAEFSFDLPDNITSWRISWQAYSPGIHVGNGSTNIDATLEFFLDYRLARTFLTGDEPKIGLRSAGIGIDPQNSQTSYTVEIPSLGYKETIEGQANIWQELSLPKLSEGEYQVKVTAANGGHNDALNTWITVTKSFTSHQQTDEAALSVDLRPPGSDTYPTTLIFSDKMYATALSSLYDLAWQDGIRLEQKIVSRIAADILSRDMGLSYFAQSEEQTLAASHEIIRYQRWNGGISSFTYAEADIETSVLAASVGKGYFDAEALSSYFYSFIEEEETEPDDKTLALWGLAALGQPVLVEINNILSDAGLSGENKLNLTMALYFAGDGARAKVHAEELIEIFAGDLSGNTKATARLALLASAFDLPEAADIASSMRDNPYDGDYYLLEKMGIALNLLRRLPEGGAGFTFTIGGKTETIDLRQNIAYSILVLPGQLDEISFGHITGNVTVTSCYQKEGRPPGGDAASGLMQLGRAIGGNRTEMVSIPQDKPVRVNIEFWVAKDAPVGCYTITDMLPAGLRFGDVESWYYYARVGGIENKEVKFSIYKMDYDRYHWWKPVYYQSDGSLKGTIVYTAYPSGTGSFTAEAPYFGHITNNNVLVHGAETRITIE